MRPYFSSTFAERWGMRSGVALLLAWLVCIPGARAGLVEITPATGINVSIPLKSIKELKYRGVIRQEYDFSCGSAAVATLLTHHYAAPVSEKDVFMAMFQRGNRAAIQREGFSLLDMKQYLEDHGYRADGIYASLDDLARVGIPAIVLIEVQGYKHFIVVKGVQNGEIMAGDPASGLKVYRRADFQKLWTNGILFVVRSKPEIAKRHFNAEWSNIARAPLGEAISRNMLANITLLRPTANDF